MRDTATIHFQDATSGDVGLATVRCDERCVGLGLSLQTDGDVEVFLERSDVERLIEALQRAVASC